MVKTAPTPSFIVTQSQLLLEFLIIAFDDPAVFRYFHQRLQRGLLRHRGEPVFGGLRFFLRPFDQEPFFRIGLGPLVIAMRGAHAGCGEAGNSRFVDCPDASRFPSRRKTANPGPVALPKRADGPHCAAGVWGRTPTWFSRWRRQRLLPGSPDGGVRFNAYRILQSPAFQPFRMSAPAAAR